MAARGVGAHHSDRVHSRVSQNVEGHVWRAGWTSNSRTGEEELWKGERRHFPKSDGDCDCDREICKLSTMSWIQTTRGESSGEGEGEGGSQSKAWMAMHPNARWRLTNR